MCYCEEAMGLVRDKGIYEKFFKRPMDLMLSFVGLILLSPILLIISLLIRVKLGTPIIFKQQRPGLNEKIFTIYKFRTMTNEKDGNGKLLPDSERLTKFGKWLRSTSLEGNDIIGQTTESLVNKGFREVSPIHFFMGRDLFSKRTDIFDIEGGMNLLALNQGQEAFRAA